MSLADIIASDTAGVLLDTDNLAQEVEHKHPRAGVSLVTVQFHGDALDAAQPSPTTERGTAIRQVAIIELATSVEVIEEEGGGRYPSYFSIGGYWWLVKRIVGTDDDSQTVEIHRTDQKSTKRASS